MKLILLLIMFSFNANSQMFADVGIDQAKINGGDLHDYYNASVEQFDDNSWRFVSNTNPSCINRTDLWNCKRADVQLVEWYQYEATMKYSFILNIEKYPAWPSPYWMIVLQDWRKQHEKDSMGRHPITTLKLKNYNGKLYLGHFDNSWQWGYKFPDTDPTDTVHSLPDYTKGCRPNYVYISDGVHHQENRCNGVYPLERNRDYYIDFIVSPAGASLIVDGHLVTDVTYKTKSNYEWSYIKWGMYWDENYNVTNDQRYQTIYNIKEFTRSIKTK